MFLKPFEEFSVSVHVALFKNEHITSLNKERKKIYMTKPLQL